MSVHDEAGRTSLSRAETPEEIGDFWDEHSLADYWEQTRDVAFELRAHRRRRVTLDPEVYAAIERQANLRGVTPETLANLWLTDRLRSQRTLKTDETEPA